MKDDFFRILRIGLWNRWTEGEEKEIRIFQEDWEKIYQLSKNHTIEGMMFNFVNVLDENCFPEENLLMRWTTRVDQIESRNKKMNSFIAAQHRWFKKNNLLPILLKGQGVAVHYPNPLLRTSGDIDWYLNKESYEKAKVLLAERGQELDSDSLKCLSYESENILIEHHRELFNLSNPFRRSYLKRLLHAYSGKFESINIQGEQISILPPILQIVQVNIHILKHLLAFGIGLRQICDSAILYSQFKGMYNKEELMQIFNDLGILKWTHLLHDILVRYFGLSEEDLPYSIPNGINGDWMMEEILSSGNFGFHDQRYQNGAITAFSVRPDLGVRLWKSLSSYFRYAPMESIFFILNRILAKPFHKKADKTFNV
ncbi:nucleotidyltransferase domain-containing protein [Sphingobacterium kyonggiense]